MAKITTITNPLTGQPAQVDQLDHTAQQIDDGIARALPGGAIDSVLSSKPNPNILDNWYFGNPIDQRSGYVVPPDTSYYANDTGALVGTTDKYYTVSSIVSDKAYFAKDGAVYNVPISAAVRGYTGAGYGIDRWIAIYHGGDGYPTEIVVLINDDGTITIKNTGNTPAEFQQRLTGLKGVYTLSTLATRVTGEIHLRLASSFNGAEYASTIVSSGINSVTSSDITSDGMTYYHFYIGPNSSVTLKAAKLELGSQQTLANQDENGNWQLNELPNYADTLARCQRYQFEAFDRSITDQGYLVHVKAISSTRVLGVLPTPVTMREGCIPSVLTDCSVDNPYNAFGTYSTGYSSGKKVITLIEVYSKMQNGVILRATGSNFVPGNDYWIWVSSQNTHQFLLDSNL